MFIQLNKLIKKVLIEKYLNTNQVFLSVFKYNVYSYFYPF